MSHVYDDYESDPWEFQEEEPEEKQKDKFISYSEPVNEQPSPKISQPVSTIHPLVPTREIQPCVSSCIAGMVVCYKFSVVFHLAYDPMKEYMDLYFLHVLKPPSFILTSTLGGKLKDVTVLLSRLHHLLPITDRVRELPFKKLLDWIWWKFSFT
jgi:hypothetical protein